MRRIEGGEPRAGLVSSLGDGVERLRRLRDRWALLDVRRNRCGIDPGAARLRCIIGDGLGQGQFALGAPGRLSRRRLYAQAVAAGVAQSVQRAFRRLA